MRFVDLGMEESVCQKSEKEFMLFEMFGKLLKRLLRIESLQSLVKLVIESVGCFEKV